MLCASRAGECARARERSDAPSERGERCPRVNGASDRRPFYHPSCGRVNAPAPPFPTFSEISGLNPLGPRKTWARRGLYPSGKPRLAGNRTERAHVAPRSRGGPGAHPLPTPARSRTQAALGGCPRIPLVPPPGLLKPWAREGAGLPSRVCFL